MILINSFVGVLSGQEITPQMVLIKDVDIQQVIFQFVLNGWLHSMNGLLIIFIVAWFFKERTVSLLLLGFMVIAVFPTINMGGWLPLGLNSMGYITGHWRDLYKITGILSFYIFVEVIVILYLFRRKNMNFY
ncbi:hypothetical protein [Paenibacillus sp. JSM ZJ436]|uniref:hypothetical protein n=1 Tax=Paenibacillus sp. JSM ZJ436 TaxID=3376190 RepID=UPI0037C5FD37